MKLHSNQLVSLHVFLFFSLRGSEETELIHFSLMDFADASEIFRHSTTELCMQGLTAATLEPWAELFWAFQIILHQRLGGKNVISHSGSEGLRSPSPALLPNDWCFMTFLSHCCSGRDLYWIAHQGWGACLLSFKPPVPIPPLPSAGLTLSLFPHLTLQSYLLL